MVLRVHRSSTPEDAVQRDWLTVRGGFARDVTFLSVEAGQVNRSATNSSLPKCPHDVT
jgi:hypothetical protein